MRENSGPVVVSFDLAAIVKIKTIDQSIRTGALFEPRHSPTRLVRKREMISAAIDCAADEILLHRSLATPRAVGLALENALSAVVWTVDDPSWRRRARNLEIHAHSIRLRFGTEHWSSCESRRRLSAAGLPGQPN